MFGLIQKTLDVVEISYMLVIMIMESNPGAHLPNLRYGVQATALDLA